MELGAPKKDSIIEGGWDIDCVNPYRAVATGERIPGIGVKGLCNGTIYIFEYWRYPGGTSWVDGRYG